MNGGARGVAQANSGRRRSTHARLARSLHAAAAAAAAVTAARSYPLGCLCAAVHTEDIAHAASCLLKRRTLPRSVLLRAGSSARTCTK